MFEIHKTKIAGFFELQASAKFDDRGLFAKRFNQGWFAENCLPINFVEQYYSVSRQRVLRGLHFQLPPHDHAKMIYCTDGEIMDVAVDLRVDSPTYRQAASVIISSNKANQTLLISGLAHGYYVLSETATVMYNVTTGYAPTHDAGVRWNSVGLDWPDLEPILSSRDGTLPRLENFDSPFRMAAKQ